MKTLNPSAAAVILSAFIMGLSGIASAQEDKSPTIPVDESNFVESMSDIYFGQVVDAVGTNVIQHNRATANIKSQGIIRENRDTLYSKVVIDARGGFRLTLPAAGKTYMAALILNYNTGLVREARDQGDVGTYMAHSDRPRVIEITREAAGTDFVYILFRTQTDNSAEGNAAGAKLQDAIKLEIHGDPKDWKPQNFDTKQRDKLADLYKSHLAEYVARGAHFGYQEDSVVKEGGEKAADVRRHYAAFGWGGQLERYATYLTTPVIKGKDGTAVTLKVTPFKVREDLNGFWSYTVYDAGGWIATENNIINNESAVLNPDGTLTLRLGTKEDCGTDANRMDLPKGGFTIVTRIYNTAKEIPLSDRASHIPIPK
ncbi:hypothetical protein CA13_58190 [Planctomycetes bacterium CA13]|uniref:DUF1214 domain-containing protein n=1 Tax=Novipirellula herctigrandis TaxID=2527986 RepID=A0A5C5ZAH7_9BACT|nr:hypothetical protein CA13_58190 [Planctomycetes bacterium CA13]